MFFLTALAVSIDAYLAGIAFIFESKRQSFYIVLCAGAYTFILSILAMCFRVSLIGYEVFFKLTGFLIFVALGIKNIVEFFRNVKEEKSVVKGIKIHAIGLGVSTDAGLASLSIGVAKELIVYASATFALLHALFVFLGLYTSKYAKIAKDAQFVAGIFLIVLGIMKLL